MGNPCLILISSAAEQGGRPSGGMLLRHLASTVGFASRSSFCVMYVVCPPQETINGWKCNMKLIVATTDVSPAVKGQASLWLLFLKKEIHQQREISVRPALDRVLADICRLIDLCCLFSFSLFDKGFYCKHGYIKTSRRIFCSAPNLHSVDFFQFVSYM